jgi:hypothetical protein
MKKFIILTPVISAILLMYSHFAHAGGVAVPEISAGGTALTLGLTIAIVTLIREYRKK